MVCVAIIRITKKKKKNEGTKKWGNTFEGIEDNIDH